MQGQVDKREVLRLMQALLDAGADRVSLADTVGYADPAMVRELFEEALKIAGERFWCGHFHDTRGLGLGQCVRGARSGRGPLRRLPGRHRRLPACARRQRQRVERRPGLHAGQHGRGPASTSPQLLALRQRVAGWLVGETLHGSLWQAGLPKTFAAIFFFIHRRRRLKALMTNDNTLPLAGIRVIEFTHMVMGPTCGMILADLGAEVIKIEPPGGDKTRKLPGLGIGFFRSFNRNKKSVVLDITTDEGRATATELIGQCDIVLENFPPRPHGQAGPGLRHAGQHYPRLIYVSRTRASCPARMRSAWRSTRWCR